MRRQFSNALDGLARFAGRVGSNLRGLLAEQRFPNDAESWLSAFGAAQAPSLGHYADLFRYFVTGFMLRRSRLGAFADYAGMPSYNGPAMDRLEGFSRIAPLVAAWLSAKRPARVEIVDGVYVDLVALLSNGIRAGTDPESEEYWGDIGHWSQAIVEAADIALSLWMTRAQIWHVLSGGDRRRIGRWLLQVNGKHIPDNNWHLFVTQVNAILAALEQPHDALEMRRHYLRVKSFYRGDGWFSDGERQDTPGYDYYNAWGFHYHLQWLRRIDPDLDSEFIDQCLHDFLCVYKYFIGPQGLPILGRSACYRMATPAPLILALSSIPDAVSAAEARRALDVVWQHFIRRGAVRRGNVTQGYYWTDRRLLEPYSGPASCLWSLRSLVAAFALHDTHPFWRTRPEPLPIERCDYRLHIATPGWTVVGDRPSGSISILTGSGQDEQIEDYPLYQCVLDLFRRVPRRPKNTLAKYHRHRYDSASPYGLSLEARV